jgi:glycosyltransferase involved in cell wall biosynthesis
VPFKGQHLLLDAVRLLAEAGIDAHLTLVGGGPSAELLKRHVRELGIEGRVDLPGPIAHDRIPARLAETDVFCMSSFLEGVPVALMEAMASEIAVVAPRIAGIPELIEDGVSGFIVSPGRADLLAEALAALWRDPELRQRFAIAGRTRVVTEFNARASGAQLARLLEESFASPDGAAPQPAADARTPPARPLMRI